MYIVLLALHCTSGEAHLIHKDLPSTSNFKVDFLVAMLISSEKPIDLTTHGPDLHSHSLVLLKHVSTSQFMTRTNLKAF